MPSTFKMAITPLRPSTQMTTKQKNPIGAFRFTPEDRKLTLALQKKLGVAFSSLVRLALRALATKEGVSV